MPIEYPRMTHEFNRREPRAHRARSGSKAARAELSIPNASKRDAPTPPLVFPEPYRQPAHRGPWPRVSRLRTRLNPYCREKQTHIVARVQLSGLFVYPIKACGGIALAEAEVVERGLAFDRRYLLVDKTGTFVSQREVPRLCLVATAFDGDTLQVSAAGKAPLELPRRPTDDADRARRTDRALREWRVWDDVGRALELESGSRWFSELLDDEVSLLYMPDSERRAVNPKRAQPGDIVSFADAYPLMLMSEASLADLNRRLDAPLDMRRFRPNLVIAGGEPYVEDGFARVQIGGLSFRGVKRCERCIVTTVDPETGELGKEPLRTLAQYRLEDGAVWLGMNLIHDACGALRLGDRVTVQPAAGR